jgi:hypothetical protein
MRFGIIIFSFLVWFSAPAQSLSISAERPLLINLPEDAASVIVGNPVHASVVLDNPRLMIVTAGLPGTTQLTVLGKRGHIIWNDRLTVNSGGGDNIRITNACINGDDQCQSTKMLSCEKGGKCHSFVIQGIGVSGGGGPGSASNNPTAFEEGSE